MADDWMIVGSDGSLGDRTTFLELIRPGELSHDLMESHDLNVRVYGDTAVIVARGAGLLRLPPHGGPVAVRAHRGPVSAGRGCTPAAL